MTRLLTLFSERWCICMRSMACLLFSMIPFAYGYFLKSHIESGAFTSWKQYLIVSILCYLTWYLFATFVSRKTTRIKLYFVLSHIIPSCFLLISMGYGIFAEQSVSLCDIYFLALWPLIQYLPVNLFFIPFQWFMYLLSLCLMLIVFGAGITTNYVFRIRSKQYE